MCQRHDDVINLRIRTGQVRGATVIVCVLLRFMLVRLVCNNYYQLC